MAELNRILLVEDEADIQTVARLALETVGGFTVQVCGSGQEALQALVSFNPDLILMDVMMPGMDGPATLSELRELPQGRDIPVVFMTAKVQRSEVQQLREQGVIDVIAKPFDPMTLADQVRVLWERAHD